MILVWSRQAWADYQHWERADLRVRDKINALIEDAQRHPFTGLGKPEPLKHQLAGIWSRRQLRALSECTIGIVGFGNIGAAVARRAASFRMRILACDIRPIDGQAVATPGVTLTTLDEVLAGSDFVTLHADLRADNRHLMDEARFAILRPSAVLINTARGPLVDETALISALRDGRLAGAALDVFEQEPLPAASPLRHMPNVYLAPHNANSSAAAAERVHTNTIRRVLEALTGVTQS